MTEVQEPVLEDLEFSVSERSGRRNALPDILGSPAGVNPADLPLKLAELSLKDGTGSGDESPTTTAEGTPDPPQSSDDTKGS